MNKEKLRLELEAIFIVFVLLFFTIFTTNIEFNSNAITGHVTKEPFISAMQTDYLVYTNQILELSIPVSDATKLTTDSEFAEIKDNKIIISPKREDVGTHVIMIIAKSNEGYDVTALEVKVVEQTLKVDEDFAQHSIEENAEIIKNIDIIGVIKDDTEDNNIEKYDINTENLEILNPKEQPQVGQYWNVMFKTQGTSDLKIQGINTYLEEDIIFSELLCGDKTKQVVIEENTIFSQNFECEETAILSNKVLTEGKHQLEFNYGTNKLFAENNATVAPWFDPATPTELHCWQNSTCYLNVNASDVDGDEDKLQYTDDTGMFTINVTTGVINFTPTNDNVGNYTGEDVIVLIVKDPTGNFDTHAIRFYIHNINDPPEIISQIPSSQDISLSENVSIPYYFNITVRDIDFVTPYSENLTIKWFFDESLNHTNYENTNEYSQHLWGLTTGFCEKQNYNLTVLVNDTAGATDFFYWNLSVDNVNRLPYLNNTVSNLSWYEDTNLTNNFSLHDYLVDLDVIECGENYTFSVNGNFDINIIINQTTGLVSFHPLPDFYGTEEVYFTITDEQGAFANTNIIELEVINTPDAPYFNLIFDQTLYANAPFYLELEATDVDDDVLTFKVNDTSLFNLSQLNTDTAIINFTPQDDQVGVYKFEFNVTDNYNSSHFDFVNLTFTINPNTIPIINNIENQNISGVKEYIINLTGFDLDGDNLTFYTNSTFFSITWYNETLSYINYTPSASHIGDYTFEFWVVDDKGAPSTKTTSNFSITEVNEPPVFVDITNLTGTINRSFKHNFTATDLENDILIFDVNVSFFNITSFNDGSLHLGLINFTPKDSDFGNHSVKINLSDGINLVNETFTFEILPNYPPEFEGNYSNLSARRNIPFILQVNATDRNNDEIRYLTDSAVNIGLSTGLINHTFTTLGMKTFNVLLREYYNGIYTGVEISQEFNINVTPENSPPVIINFTPSDIELNMTENVSRFFNITAEDPDGDEITYYWYLKTLNYTNSSGNWTYEVISTSLINTGTSSFNFTPDFLMAGMKNLTVLVKDANNLSSNLTWNINISNTNRPPIQLTTINNVTGWFASTVHSWIRLKDYMIDYDKDDYFTLSFPGSQYLVFYLNGKSTSSNIFSANLSTQDLTVMTPSTIGSDTFRINMTDDKGASLLSNEIKVEWDRLPESGAGTSSGGTTIRRVTETITVVEEFTTPITINIIVPEPMKSLLDQTIVAPITLENTGERILYDITLDTEPNPFLEVNIQDNYFGVLYPGDTEKTNMLIRTTGDEFDYAIKVIASVNNPSFNDSAIFYLSTVQTGSEEVDQLNVRVAFVSDLLNSESACFDLKENLKEAQAMIKRGSLNEASKYLEDLTSLCRYLSSRENDIITEKPVKLEEDNTTNIIYGASALTAFIIVSLFVMKISAHNKKAKRRKRR